MISIEFVAGWAVRSSVLVLAGGLLLRALRVKDPAVRLTAWSAILIGSLCLPALMATLPDLSLGVWRGAAITTSLAAVERSTGAPVTAEASIPQPVSPESGVPNFSWRPAAFLAYSAIAAALLLRLFCGWALSRRVCGRSRPTGIAEDVRESEEVDSPVTVGVIRPAILLPKDWREWSAGTLGAVLAHERSHVRRRDPALQILSAIHRSLLWATPTAWWLHRGIVRTAEEVSDDDAIVASGDRAGYAEILLGFVQRSGPKTEWVGAAMARYDRPEARIRRILHSVTLTRGATRAGTTAVGVAGAILACVAAAVQLSARPQDTPTAKFEVASVKPAPTTGERMQGVKVYPGARVRLSTLSVKALTAVAFGMPFWQIRVGERWMEEEEFDIDAKPSEAVRSRLTTLRYTNFEMEDPLLREMLQSLLVERFQLRVRRESKTGEVHALEREDRAFRGKVVEKDADEKTFGSIGYVGAQWSIHSTSMPQLAKFASNYIVRTPVFDRTGLTDQFDYRQRVPDESPVYGGDQSVSFRAYLKELGLKLTRSQGPVETLVIEHAARPTPN